VGGDVKRVGRHDIDQDPVVMEAFVLIQDHQHAARQHKGDGQQNGRAQKAEQQGDELRHDRRVFAVALLLSKRPGFHSVFVGLRLPSGGRANADHHAGGRPDRDDQRALHAGADS